MEFSDFLTNSASKIESTIEKYQADWRAEIVAISPRLTHLIDTFTTSWEGGKRLRGALVVLGYEMSGGVRNEAIYQAAVAYEIFQTSILAHDDIVDLSPLRRGKPTVYRQLGGDHYGISQTICLGDTGFFLANKLIVDADFAPEIKIAALHHFSRMVINTCLGEMLDIELPRLSDGRNEDDVNVINKLKTADYTISYPLIIGATLAGQSTQQTDRFKEFGDKLGIAFQIQDDILGVFGDEKALGKSVTSDIEEGKNTLLFTHAYQNSNADQKQILDDYYGKGPITTDQLEQIKKVMIDTGSLEYSKQQAQTYVDEAKKLIPGLTDSNLHQQLLTEMADFLVNREK